MAQPTRRHALVVGGDGGVRDLLRTYLRRARFAVHELGAGGPAIERIRRDRFDLIVLAQALADVDGISLCRAARAAGRNTTTPIVLLLSTGGVSETVLGLESGADDCLALHFATREFVARLCALLRRTVEAERPAAMQERICIRGLTIDPERRHVIVRGRTIALPPQEFELLYTLASRPGIVFSRASLLRRVWPHDHDLTGRTVDTTVSRLRGKIEGRSGSPELILTIWSIGYSFNAE